MVNIGDISDPVILGSYDTPGDVEGVYVKDNLAYIADQHEDLQILDVTDPTQPSFVGEGHFDSSTRYGILVEGDYCYIAGWNNELVVFEYK